MIPQQKENKKNMFFSRIVDCFCRRNWQKLIWILQDFGLHLMLVTLFFPIPKNFYSYVLGSVLFLSAANWVLTPVSYKKTFSNYRPYLSYFALYIVFLVSVAYSRDPLEGLSMCGKWFSLVIFPILFIGMTPRFFTPSRIRSLTVALITGCLLESVMKVYRMVPIFLTHPDLTPFHQQGFLTALNEFLGSQFAYMMGYEILHPTFEALFLNLAFCIIAYNWIKGDRFFKNWGRKILAFTVLAFFGILLVTSNSKAGQIMFFFSLAGLLAQVVVCRNYFSGGTIVLLLVLGGIVLGPKIADGIQHRMQESIISVKDLKEKGLLGKTAECPRDEERPFNRTEIEDDASALPRIYCWKVALGIIKEHPVLGVGVGSRSVYKAEFSRNMEYRNQYDHAHNQFLTMLVSNGIVGLVLFLWILWDAFKLVVKEKEVLWWVWFLALLLVCMTDTFFNNVYAFLYLGGIYGFLTVSFRQKKAACS